MSDYRRYFVPGGTYFLTLVTYDRRSILVGPDGCPLLRQAIRRTWEQLPFELIANVLLPDHWHVVLSLPPGDSDYSTRIARIKQRFTNRFLAAGGIEAPVTPSQARRGERGVWQPRFWEHTVRDEEDLERCVDYVHWNPRKHNMVRRVRDWPWSSFHRFVDLGHYDIDWGGEIPDALTDRRDWGE